ncbi:peptidase S8/S53 domain-containing protein [Annulohypoxylon moriforme]|nr:peptidase S8/S53 domain-containing protein [Annulohypoxylon moriforme]
MNPADKDQIQLNKRLSVERDEAFQVLDWLKKSKNVKKIISLTVPDRLVNPHDELKIAEKVDLFKVEVLNWRLLDMCISIMTEEAKNRLTELHLYSSGKRAVISHWLSKEGIGSLKELKSLYIYVVNEMGSDKWCRDTKEYIEKMIRGKTFGNLTHPDIKVSCRFWNPAPHLDNLDEIAKRVAPRLSQFIQSYRGLAFRRHQSREDNKIGFVATKVAIIDNGILAISPQSHDKMPGDADSSHTQDENTRALHEAGSDQQDNAQKILAKTPDEINTEFLVDKSVWSRIKEGRSFVDENFKLSPWLFASNPHGTQMANLICAIDPLCELYVAKVSDGRYGMTPGRVARAINWAIEKNVDIISMSFTIISPTEDEELRLALDAAAGKGIVMICSSHDEGTKVPKAWPADHEGQCILVIAGCDEYGTPLREIGNKCTCMLHGQNIAAGIIPFLEPNDRITGSSVATALAAGLGSLTLSCDRLVEPERSEIYQKQNWKRAESIKQRFYEMRSTSDSKYVLLDKFGGIDSKMRVGGSVDAEDVLLYDEWSATWAKAEKIGG